MNAKISALSKDHTVVAYQTYTAAKQEVQDEFTDAQVQRYISEYQAIARNYRLRFSGFSYQNGALVTSAQAQSGSGDSIGDVSNFIHDFRVGSGSKLFTLNPVTAVGGSAQMRTLSVGFSVRGAAPVSVSASSKTQTGAGTDGE